MAETITTGKIYCTKDTHTTSIWSSKVSHSEESNACGRHSDGYQAYAFFSFAEHGIPSNAIIVSAVFGGHVAERLQSASFTQTIRPCGGAWDETMTYSQMPTSSGVTSQVTLGNKGTDFTADITNVAQAWFGGGFNYANGFYITSSEAYSYKRIYARGASEARKPYIKITYYVPASKPTFSVSSTNIAVGVKVTINTNWMSTKYKHDLSWKLTKGNGSTTTGKIATGVGASTIWEMSLNDVNTMLSFLNDVTSATLSIVCTTYDETGAELGVETSSGKTMYVPSNVVPTISNITITSNKTLEGRLVQGISSITVNTSASGGNGATISNSKYQTVIGGITYTGNPVTSSVLTSSGAKELSVTVTDSRGRTKSTSRNFTVHAYAAPKITNISVERCNSSGTIASIDGEYLRFTLAASASSIDAKNTLTVKVYTKLRIDTEWTPVNTYTSSSNSVNYTNQLLENPANPDGTYSALSSYDIMFELTDTVGTTTVWQGQIGTQNVLINFDPNNMRVKFGGIAEDDDANNAVTFGTDVYFKDGMYMPDGRNVPDALAELEGTINNMSVERIYTSLSSIGCTTSSTMTQAWQALPAYSCLMLEGTTLSSLDSSWGASQLPSGLYGWLIMRKFSGNPRGEIRFIYKYNGCTEFRMALTNTSLPTGVWYCSFVGLYSVTEPAYEAGVIWLKPVE